MTKRELEQKALELLYREDETMDEIKYGDVERDRVQQEIANVVEEYKDIKSMQEKLEFVMECIDECYSQDDNTKFFDKFIGLIEKKAAEIGYDISTRDFED